LFQLTKECSSTSFCGVMHLERKWRILLLHGKWRIPSCKIGTKVLLWDLHFHFIYMGLNFGQTIWHKTESYWEQLEERFGNLGTLRELDGNTLRTIKNLFISLSSPHPLKKKKLDCSWVHAKPSHRLHQIFLSKAVHHHFSPMLMAGFSFKFIAYDGCHNHFWRKYFHI
jgi:hypothetical protein